jgi:hypothetical protein
MPLFSSDEYAWKDMSVVVAGRKVTGIQGVKYKPATEKEYVFGAGNKPRAVATGNKTFEGEITLLQNEVERLNLAAQDALSDPLSDLTDLPGVDIVITYNQGQRVRTDMLLGVHFQDFEMGMEQNDKFMTITIPFMALDVKLIA